jgi:hypothetical protein
MKMQLLIGLYQKLFHNPRRFFSHPVLGFTGNKNEGLPAVLTVWRCRRGHFHEEITNCTDDTCPRGTNYNALHEFIPLRYPRVSADARFR